MYVGDAVAHGSLMGLSGRSPHGWVIPCQHLITSKEQDISKCYGIYGVWGVIELTMRIDEGQW